MPPITRFADRCLQPSVTTGTIPFVLGPFPPGYRPIGSVYAQDEPFPYCAEGLDFAGALAGQWEVGRGHLNASGHLVRDHIFASSSGGTIINFNAVQLRVFVVPAAAALMVAPTELGYIEMLAGSAPDVPAPGFGRIYQRDNKLYFMASDGLELELTPTPGDGLIIDDQVTVGLPTGVGCYVSDNNTWLRARSNGTALEATLEGAFVGTVGSMVFKGRTLAMDFTVAGGSPNPGELVFLAASVDDAGTGLGKLTAIAPDTGFLVTAGICLNNSNYASLKTSTVLFNPRSPVVL